MFLFCSFGGHRYFYHRFDQQICFFFFIRLNFPVVRQMAKVLLLKKRASLLYHLYPTTSGGTRGKPTHRSIRKSFLEIKRSVNNVTCRHLTSCGANEMLFVFLFESTEVGVLQKFPCGAGAYGTFFFLSKLSFYVTE